MKKRKRYVISDIHGNARPFLKLLDHVDPDPEDLIILGDLGDRGFQTWEVFEECAQLVDEGTDIIMGNHDFWFLQYSDNKMTYAEFTHENIGGLTTLKSFELASKKHGNDHVSKTVAKVYESMCFYYEADDYIFVHAGIDPRLPYMDIQKPEVLMMGCDDWRNPKLEHTFEQTIIFGHTPTPRIHKAITEDDARIWSSKRAKKMAIDTGAGFGLRLTLADLHEGIAYAYDFEQDKILEYRFKKRERGEWIQ